MKNEVTTIEQIEIRERAFAFLQREIKPYLMTPMIPNHLRDDGSLMILKEVSEEYNMKLVFLAQEMYMVKGNFSISGKLSVAMINNSGKADHGMRWEIEGEGTPQWRVRAWNTIDGEKVFGEWLTDDIVTKAGWKKNQHWVATPIRMAKYRTATYWARDYMPEVLMGFSEADEIIETEAYNTSSYIDETEPKNAKGLNQALSASKEDKNATEAILEVHDPISGEVMGADLRDIKEEEIYPSKEEAERDHPIIVDPDLSPLDELKLKADELGVSYRKDIGFETLEKKIKAEEAENERLSELMDGDIDAEISSEIINEDEIPV